MDCMINTRNADISGWKADINGENIRLSPYTLAPMLVTGFVDRLMDFYAKMQANSKTCR